MFTLLMPANVSVFVRIPYLLPFQIVPPQSAVWPKKKKIYFLILIIVYAVFSMLIISC